MCTGVCLLFALYLATLGCMLTRMVFCFYFWVYNVLKRMIYLGGHLSPFAFLQSTYCSSFQQIFLLGLANVSCIPQRMNICS